LLRTLFNETGDTNELID
jgi:hypothetical protein